MMRPATALLHAPHYVLGERELDHRKIEGLDARAAELSMVPNARLWGWGSVWRTERDLAELAIESGAGTLRAAGAEASSVDALVLCSTRFPGGPRTHGEFVERILTGLGLDRAAFLGVTLNRCTNLLVAIDVARALVLAGRHRRVLVITTDRIEDEADRMESFALFSDGAASCLVTAAAEGGDDPAPGTATRSSPPRAPRRRPHWTGRTRSAPTSPARPPHSCWSRRAWGRARSTA